VVFEKFFIYPLQVSSKLRLLHGEVLEEEAFTQREREREREREMKEKERD
jgi:hypothetical protein